MYTVMVRPMARREFVGTRISRVFERFLLRRFEKLGMI
jgi:predicted HAD superfamily phosphohydrolase YqeG